MDLDQVIEYIWVPIVIGASALWSRVNGHGTRIALLEQAKDSQRDQREEDRRLSDAQRLEVLDRIDLYQNAIMKRLDSIESRMNSK